MTKRKRNRGTYLFGLIIAALAVVGWGAGPGGWFRPDEQEALKGVPVRRGDLRISEVARGNLEAKDSIRLVNDLEGRATIIYLIEEGTHVEPGDLICELDVSDLRDERVTQEIAVKNAEASFTKAREQYEIQEIQNQSDIAEAELALELARLDLEKYEAEEGEWTHELAQADEAIKIAQEELKQAEETLRWTTELEAKGFVQRTELEKDQLTVERARIKVEQARRDKDLKVAYGDRRKRAELQAEVETRQRDVLKVEKQARAQLADDEAARESARFKLEREKEKLEKIDGQIGKANIYAPEAGMVVYARKKSRFGAGEVPEEGGEVHERQEIVTIPRPGGMIADVSLHETKLEKVRIGQRCIVTVDALPGQTFEGEVEFVAAVADSGSWMTNPSQRLYKTQVRLRDAVVEMRPGMSCSIEILVEDLDDVLYVPRQAVFMDGDTAVCFVDEGGSPVKRPVDVGLDNNKWIEVEGGLQAGETVLLSPPASWEPAPATTPAADLRARPPEETLPIRPEGGPGAEETDEGGRSGFGGFGGGQAGGGFSPEMRERFRAMRESGQMPSAEDLQELMKDMPADQRERMESMMRRMQGGEGGRSRGEGGRGPSGDGEAPWGGGERRGRGDGERPSRGDGERGGRGPGGGAE